MAVVLSRHPSSLNSMHQLQTHSLPASPTNVFPAQPQAAMNVLPHQQEPTHQEQTAPNTNASEQDVSMAVDVAPTDACQDVPADVDADMADAADQTDAADLCDKPASDVSDQKVAPDNKMESDAKEEPAQRPRRILRSADPLPRSSRSRRAPDFFSPDFFSPVVRSEATSSSSGKRRGVQPKPLELPRDFLVCGRPTVRGWLKFALFTLGRCSWRAVNNFVAKHKYHNCPPRNFLALMKHARNVDLKGEICGGSSVMYLEPDVRRRITDRRRRERELQKQRKIKKTNKAKKTKQTKRTKQTKNARKTKHTKTNKTTSPSSSHVRVTVTAADNNEQSVSRANRAAKFAARHFSAVVVNNSTSSNSGAPTVQASKPNNRPVTTHPKTHPKTHPVTPVTPVAPAFQHRGRLTSLRVTRARVRASPRVRLFDHSL